MILVLISWFYIFFTSVTLGLFFNHKAKLKCNNSITISFIGFISATILASFWAIFGRINIEFHVFLFFINFILGVKYKTELINTFKSIINQIQRLPKSIKIFLFITTLLITVKCASFSNYIDNETYYIQTIKWLNEYGFVKGLVNLHVFLGQTSGWHIAQSAFSFSFLHQDFNDINGFCLILINFFALLKLNSFWQNRNPLFLIIGLLPITNLLLFQFISTPSPDLAVYLISSLLFYYFIKHFDNIETGSYNLIFIFSIFIVYIKITSFPILLLPLFLLVLNFKKLYLNIYTSYIFGIILFGLFIVKNLIITGYPFFPSHYLKDVFSIDYKLPTELYTFSFNNARLYESTVLKSEFATMNVFQIFIKWLFYSKIDSLFNSLITITILIAPYFLKKYFNKKSYWILYIVFILQLLFLFLTSPQYRFILNFVFIFGLLISSCFIKEKRIIIYPFYFGIILILLTYIYPIKPYTTQIKKKIFKVNSSFLIENLLVPYDNSNLNTNYTVCKIGNLEYYSPDKKTIIWATGNGKLPCLNEKQVLFFKRKYGYIPQKRTNDVKDGFYSKKTLLNE